MTLRPEMKMTRFDPFSGRGECFCPLSGGVNASALFRGYKVLLQEMCKNSLLLQFCKSATYTIFTILFR